MKTQATNKKFDAGTLDLVIENSLQLASNARSVYNGLDDGSVSISEAVEKSNAIGKENAALGNVIKSMLVKHAMMKVEIASTPMIEG